MNLIVAIPLEVRLAALFVLGVCMGSLANLGVYRLAWHPRSISPWSSPDPQAPPRRPSDRLPIVGWLGLRREAELHGMGFWVRPLLLELGTGIALAALYWWEIDRLGLLMPAVPQRPALGLLAVLHTQYVAHVVLVSLMLVASIIDADEKTIPDTITVPGTLLGLVLAAACPWSLLMGQAPLPNTPLLPLGSPFPPGYWDALSPSTWPFLQVTSPYRLDAWPPWLDGPWALLIALACWWLWCVGLMPRSWYSRHGYRRALQLSLARLVRESATYRIFVMGALGSAAIAAVWLLGGRGWAGLLSGLVGMAAGGGLVWLVRIIGTAALGREAMGFGDVTLMAMIGAFLGWQACLIVFFIAPFAGLVVGLLQVILVRDSRIPYGPFLCLGAVVAVVCWAALWDRTWEIFALGWMIPVLTLCCLGLMSLMLGAWKLIRDALS